MDNSNCKGSQLTLSKRLLGLQVEEEQTIGCFVECIHGIEKELQMGGYQVSDSDKRFALLGGLQNE